MDASIFKKPGRITIKLTISQNCSSSFQSYGGKYF